MKISTILEGPIKLVYANNMTGIMKFSTGAAILSYKFLDQDIFDYIKNMCRFKPGQALNKAKEFVNKGKVEYIKDQN